MLTRSEAASSGAKRYFTGRPCKNGHTAERYTVGSNCVDCLKQRTMATPNEVLNERVQRWRSVNRERYNEWGRDWYQDNREKAVETVRTWQRNNPGKVRAGKRRWYATEKGRASQVAWVEANPEKRRATNARRWARKAEAPGTFSDQFIIDTLSAQSGVCAAAHCSTEITSNYSIDHIVPLSRGGSNWPENIQLLCVNCNSSKGNRDADEWQASKLAEMVELRTAA